MSRRTGSARPRTLGLFALTLGCGIAIGFGLGGSVASGEPAATAKAQAKAKPAPADYSRYRKLDMFARALTIVEQYYVRPVDSEELIYAAVRGLVSQLDAHTAFLQPREAKLLREDIEGAFGGVGMVVILGRDPSSGSYLEIRDIIPDGPADDAGLSVGNWIVAIEGQSIAQFADLTQAIMKIRGEPGTAIKVTIRDRTKGIKRTIALTREVIDPPAVEVRYLGEGLGFLRLREFSESATREVIGGLSTLRQQAGKTELRGVVLDLRDNGGGLLDEAIGIVNVFVPDGVIVRTRGRRGRILDEAHARRPGTEGSLPLVVLVNKASASASEIVAGALQDHERGLIIGERTYGKGSVQAPFELSDGSMLKLTTALYYTPDDRLIQASGIAPDVYVGLAPPGAVPNRDSRPELKPERAHPRHLRPEDFGSVAPPAKKEGPALRAAGDDLQLRSAVQHLAAWDRLKPRLQGRRKRR